MYVCYTGSVIEIYIYIILKYILIKRFSNIIKHNKVLSRILVRVLGY